MRLSSIQRGVLFVLYAIEQKGSQDPVPSLSLFKMINSSRDSKVFDTNFRASCHKLNQHDLVDKYRTPSLKLAWALTEAGKEKAKSIFESEQ